MYNNNKEENLDVLLKAKSAFSVPIHSTNKSDLKITGEPWLTTIEKLKYLGCEYFITIPMWH